MAKTIIKTHYAYHRKYVEMAGWLFLQHEKQSTNKVHADVLQTPHALSSSSLRHTV